MDLISLCRNWRPLIRNIQILFQSWKRWIRQAVAHSTLSIFFMFELDRKRRKKFYQMWYVVCSFFLSTSKMYFLFQIWISHIFDYYTTKKLYSISSLIIFMTEFWVGEMGIFNQIRYLRELSKEFNVILINLLRFCFLLNRLNLKLNWASQKIIQFT